MKTCCPNCDHEFEIQITADLAGDQTLSFKIIPEKGAMLSVSHVGGMMRSFERLQTTVAKEFGMRMFVGLRGLSMDADGAVQIDAMLMQQTDRSEQAAAEMEGERDG